MLIRRSNLFRHSLLGIPFVNYTKTLYNETNLYGTKMDSDKFGDFSNEAIYLSPRSVHLDEIQSFESLKALEHCVTPASYFDELDNVVGEKSKSIGIYYKINYSWRNFEKDEILRRYFTASQEDGASKRYITIPTDETEEVHANKKIGIANIKVKVDYNLLALGKDELTRELRKDIFSIINEAVRYRCDIVILPELCVPHQWLSLLTTLCKKHKICIIAGLTYIVNSQRYAFNVVATLLPVVVKNYTECLVKLRIKNHYAPAEILELEDKGFNVPKQEKSFYHLFHWRKSYFSVYNCYELASIEDRGLFKSQVDFIVATECNKDIPYYSEIAGSWVRDLHCYFIQVNTSQYGDSRIMKPTRSEERNLVVVKGGINAITLIDDIDIESLRKFQLQGNYNQDKNPVFKKLPPHFDIENVKKRIADNFIGENSNNCEGK